MLDLVCSERMILRADVESTFLRDAKSADSIYPQHMVGGHGDIGGADDQDF